MQTNQRSIRRCENGNERLLWRNRATIANGSGGPPTNPQACMTVATAKKGTSSNTFAAAETQAGQPSPSPYKLGKQLLRFSARRLPSLQLVPHATIQRKVEPDCAHPSTDVSFSMGSTTRRKPVEFPMAPHPLGLGSFADDDEEDDRIKVIPALKS
ncbi:hypothetical protein EDC04DRAFT_2693367 [Pisolithus marmoratus]|nr:hypothetical protein EDC04DRAFT_2693367 [Pisolithus marmoratus]